MWIENTKNRYDGPMKINISTLLHNTTSRFKLILDFFPLELSTI